MPRLDQMLVFFENVNTQISLELSDANPASGGFHKMLSRQIPPISARDGQDFQEETDESNKNSFGSLLATNMDEDEWNEEVSYTIEMDVKNRKNQVSVISDSILRK